MATKKCPVCGVSVKVENLERHVRNQHPHAELEPENLLTRDERGDVERTKRPAKLVLTRSGRRLILIVVVVIAVVFFLAIANPFRGVGPAVGQLAPDFALATSDGSTLRLSSLRGMPVLLEFMDTDCPACQREAPTLVSLAANYSASVRFVSIDVDFVGASDTDAKIAAFKSAYGTSWAYALDASHATTNAYGITSTPTTFVLDRSGIVVAIVHPPANTYADYASILTRVIG